MKDYLLLNGRKEFVPPLEIGTKVNPYGKIASIYITGCERYYFLIRKFRKGKPMVSLMPASLIESMIKNEK